MTKSGVLVSIILPFHIYDNYLDDAIESVIGQSFESWELLLIDNSISKNNIKNIKNNLIKDSRVRLISFFDFPSAACARNCGLEQAKGRYIAFLDSDDIWHPDKLARQLLFMKMKKAAISFTSYELINSKGVSKGKIFHAVNKLSQTDYLKNTIIGLSTSMIDTKIVGNKFRFINIKTRHDANLWIDLLGQGVYAFGLDEVLVQYRVHKGSISANKFKSSMQVWNLYFNIRRFGVIKSAYYFFFYAYSAIRKRI